MDEDLNDIRKKVVSSKAHDIAMDSSGVLWIREIFFVPRIDGITEKI